MNRESRYDPYSLWLVLQSQPDKTLVHSFDHGDKAMEFAKTYDPQTGPFKLARTALEQVAPVLAAAAQVAIGIIRSEKHASRKLHGAANFLETSLRYAAMDRDLPELYKATRRQFMYGSQVLADRVQAATDALRPYLDLKLVMR
jgi:hypothetical protein